MLTYIILDIFALHSFVGRIGRIQNGKRQLEPLVYQNTHRLSV